MTTIIDGIVARHITPWLNRDSIYIWFMDAMFWHITSLHFKREERDVSTLEDSPPKTENIFYHSTKPSKSCPFVKPLIFCPFAPCETPLHIGTWYVTFDGDGIVLSFDSTSSSSTPPLSNLTCPTLDKFIFWSWSLIDHFANIAQFIGWFFLSQTMPWAKALLIICVVGIFVHWWAIIHNFSMCFTNSRFLLKL